MGVGLSGALEADLGVVQIMGLARKVRGVLVGVISMMYV